LAEPLSAEESAYDELANDEMSRAVKNLEDAVNRSFIILAAAQREGFWDASSRLSNLRSASEVLKGAKKRLLSHFGWLSAHDSRKEHREYMESFSRIPKSEELRQVLVTLARDTLDDLGAADSDRFDALCILRRLSPETLKEYDSEVEGTIRRRHAYNEGTSPFTDDGTLVLVDDLEAWWVKIEAEWRDAAEQRLRSTQRDLARELILRFQDTEGPQAAITELNRLAELGWIDVRHDDGSPSLEFTILAMNWVKAKSGSEPPAEIKEAASDRQNTEFIYDERYDIPDALSRLQTPSKSP